MTRIKGSLRSQRSIIKYTALIETVLINERSIEDMGNIGALNDCDNINRFHTKDDNTPKGGALRQFLCCW